MAEYWAEDARRSKKDGRRLKTRLSTNIVLSVPKGNPSRVLAAAQDFAHANFSNHDWVMALHTDTKHPHVHLAVRNRGKDERRLHIAKGKPQEWRESLAASLRAHGIDAEATRRAERGVVRTGESQTIRHIRDRTGRPAATDKSAMRLADNCRRGQRPPEPWRETIDRRQQQVRSQWHKAIEYEHTNGSPQLAKMAEEFLKSMPAVQTRNDRMVRFVKQRRERTTVRDNVNVRDEPER